ncbi:hypothetical protein [Devosia sediminis]|uniref:Uncharacterized protein n=1 Tax=Devosia sediminis TaxID=2798801 RepID=A0A934J2I3_9HYPH|nr:hypothetical protein [Devosia sediminis]MBJ3787048.1 hypothetical protein [Devosia sediminis]
MKTRLPSALLALFALSSPTHAAEPIARDRIITVCVETVLQNCKVLTAGFLNVDWGDDEGKPMLAWQTQSGFTPEDGVLGGFVLLQHVDGNWARFDAGFDGWRFFPPRLSQDGLLHLPGYTGGTGSYNADRLYQWNDTEWEPIDIKTWRKAIAEQLPADREIWKGVQYDFDNPWSKLVARTALWRGDDGNCCPTGGHAEIVFSVKERRLTVDHVDYLPAAEMPGPLSEGVQQ